MSSIAASFDERQEGLRLGTGYAIEDYKRENLLDINDNSKGHTLIVGDTRSTLLRNMIAQDIRAGRSVGVIDPGADPAIWESMVREARNVGRSKELVYVSDIYPEFGAKINPLAYIDDEGGLIRNITACALYGNEASYRAALETTTLIVKTLLFRKRGEGKSGGEINFEDICALVSRDGILKCKEIANSMLPFDDEAATALELAKKILSSGSDYFDGISATLGAALADIATGTTGRLTGVTRDNILIKKLENQERTIFCVHTLAAVAESSKPVSRALIAMFQSLSDRLLLKGGRLDVPCRLYIDDCENIAYRGLENFFSDRGKANFRITAFVSRPERVDSAIGADRTKRIFDNADTKIFTRTISLKTAQYLSAYNGVIKPEDILSLKDREFYYIGREREFLGEYASAPIALEKTDNVGVKNLVDIARVMIKRNFLYNS
jgi:hypothetical protein